jgi:hypothetical protein
MQNFLIGGSFKVKELCKTAPFNLKCKTSRDILHTHFKGRRAKIKGANHTLGVRYCSLATEPRAWTAGCWILLYCLRQGIWPLIAANCKGGHVTLSRSAHTSKSHPLRQEPRHPYLTQLSLAQVIHPRDKHGRCVRP